ncbi:MAG: TetR/AcrR family transcriptional regulator [Anaerolineae bacterium]|nr:TetR/AcrR family transcriptional regulator [Anaerolineae bacterium]
MTVDRRERRSKRLLGDALVELLKEKSLHDISIRELTERADVGYVTFYRHYDTKEGLLVDRLRETIQEQMAALADCDQQGELIFAFVADHAYLFQVLLTNPGAGLAKTLLKRMLAEFFRPDAVEQTWMPPALQAECWAAVVIALVEWWIESRMAYSAEAMTAIYTRLVSEGLPVHTA